MAKHFNEEMADILDAASDDPDDIIDREELEIALYSSIHYEYNQDSDIYNTPTDGQDQHGEHEINNLFHIDVGGNSKQGFKAMCTTSDLVLNEILGEHDDVNVESNLCADFFNSPIKPYKKNQIAVEGHFCDLDTVESKAHAKICTKASPTDSAIVISDSSSIELGSDSEEEWEVLDEIVSDDDNLHVNIHHEHRHLLKGEQETSDKDWGICEDDSFGQVRTRPRYYRSKTNFRCHSCNEVGHAARDCPKKKVQTCLFCGERGHISRQCPDSICYNCFEPGHDSKTCESRRRYPKMVCHRCNMQGHDQYKCPDNWRQYHNTVNEGNLRKGTKRKRGVATYCYNCAADDHLGHECDCNRIDRYSTASYPFVCRYESSPPVDNKHTRFDEVLESSPKKKKVSTESEKKLSAFVPLYKADSNPSGRNNFDKLMLKQPQSETTKKKKKKNVKKSNKECIDLTVSSTSTRTHENIHRSVSTSKRKEKKTDSPVTVTITLGRATCQSGEQGEPTEVAKTSNWELTKKIKSVEHDSLRHSKLTAVKRPCKRSHDTDNGHELTAKEGLVKHDFVRDRKHDQTTVEKPFKHHHDTSCRHELRNKEKLVKHNHGNNGNRELKVKENSVDHDLGRKKIKTKLTTLKKSIKHDIERDKNLETTTKKRAVKNIGESNNKRKKVTQNNTKAKSYNSSDIVDLTIVQTFHKPHTRTVVQEDDFPRSNKRVNIKSFNREPWVGEDDSLFSLRSVKSGKPRDDYLEKDMDCYEGNGDGNNDQRYHNWPSEKIDIKSEGKKVKKSRKRRNRRKKRKID